MLFSHALIGGIPLFVQRSLLQGRAVDQRAVSVAYGLPLLLVTALLGAPDFRMAAVPV